MSIEQLAVRLPLAAKLPYVSERKGHPTLPEVTFFEPGERYLLQGKEAEKLLEQIKKLSPPQKEETSY